MLRSGRVRPMSFPPRLSQGSAVPTILAMSGAYFDSEPRRPRNNPFGAMRMWSITIWLVAINVAVFAFDALSDHRLFLAGYFSATKAIYQLQLWRFITFQFLHANTEHIVFNMISLYFFGPIVENYLGRARYLAFYLLCGASGAAMYMLLMYGHVLDLTPDTPLVGASAGIFGILIASARVAPNAGDAAVSADPDEIEDAGVDLPWLGGAVDSAGDLSPWKRQRRRRSRSPRWCAAGIPAHHEAASAEHI